MPELRAVAAGYVGMTAKSKLVFVAVGRSAVRTMRLRSWLSAVIVMTLLSGCVTVHSELTRM